MTAYLLLAVLAAGEPVAKVPPPTPEPDWNAWSNADPKAKLKAADAWKVLAEFKLDREYGSEAELRQARQKVDDAYAVLDADAAAACATGSERVRAAKDDWERLMTASTVRFLGKEKGEPVLLWAMGKSKSVDHSFEPIHAFACEIASKRRPADLEALGVILYVREAYLTLRLHAWYIRTHECLYYVFGRFGPGAVPYLRGKLTDPDPYVRRNAAMTLGFFLDKESKPALLKMVDAGDIGSGGAAFALGELNVTDAAPAIAKLLKHSDAMTRFWACYALYEMRSVKLLDEVEAAFKIEANRDTKREMQATIAFFKAGAKPYSDGEKKLTPAELEEAFKEAEAGNGIRGDVEGIGVSAGRADLERLEKLRLRSMDIPSDRGNKFFQRWTAAIKDVHRRTD